MKPWRRIFASRVRRGFTLTEVLVATAVTTVVVAQVATALVATLRGIEASMADVELALETRSMREKLLYRIADDGGLMSACQTGLTLGNGSGNGKNNTLNFKPVKGQSNKLSLDGSKKIVADRSKKSKWLERGRVQVTGSDIFSISNDILEVTLDMGITVGTRTYSHRHRCKAQIINNK